MDSTDPDATAYDGPLNKPKTQSGRSISRVVVAWIRWTGWRHPRLRRTRCNRSVSLFRSLRQGKMALKPVTFPSRSTNRQATPSVKIHECFFCQRSGAGPPSTLDHSLLVAHDHLWLPRQCHDGVAVFPFGQGGMTVETVNKLGKRSFVRLLVIGKRSGEDLRARMVVGVGISERLSQEPCSRSEDIKLP